MFRYVAALWNYDSSTACDTAAATELAFRKRWPNWSCVLSIPGTVVYCERLHSREGGTALLPDQRGILLGIAFSRRDGRELTRNVRGAYTESALSYDALCNTRGRHAIETLWGSFVVIFVSRDHSRRYVLRSPAAALPCFHSQHNGVHIFFSEVNDFCAIHTGRLSINWSLIRAQAALGDHLTRETGIVEIDSLEGGECVAQIDSGATHTFLWNPCKVANEPAIESFPDAVASIRHETQNVVQTWASRYESVLVELSGGLDSSIVLSCLASARSRPRLHCVNFYAAGCPGDERHFARSMAAKVRAPLHEVPRLPTCELSVFLHCHRTARPSLNFTGPGRFAAVSELVDKYECDAVFDGEFGDNVFGWAASAEPVSDHLYRRGPLPRLLTIARDVARMKRISIWCALTRGIRYSLFPSWTKGSFAFMNAVGGRDPGARGFITQEALDAYRHESERYVHSWFREVAMPAPSSVLIICGLLLATSTELHIPFSEFNTLNYVHPLVSHPLLEIALRIPGAFSVRSGWNRAVARVAFSNDLATDVLQRTCKTSTTPWVTETIRQHAPWLREFLLDGALARQGILDRSRVEDALSDRVSPDAPTPAELFYHIYIEGWLRQWLT